MKTSVSFETEIGKVKALYGDNMTMALSFRQLCMDREKNKLRVFQNDLNHRTTRTLTDGFILVPEDVEGFGKDVVVEVELY